MIKVKAHTCYLGKTGFAAHARGFFRELSKYVELRVRNYTWDDNPNYLNSIDLSVLEQISLSLPEGGHGDFPIQNSFPDRLFLPDGPFSPDVDLVLMDLNHHYFYENYTAPVKIAYTVWESTQLPDDFFLCLLNRFDYLWVPTEWHKQVAVKQGYPWHRVFVVNEGVDLEFCNDEVPKKLEEYDDGRFKFLFFGRWDYRKAVPEIVKTFLETFREDEPVDLVLSADNPYSVDGMGSTEERLEHYGLVSSRVKVKHFVTREEYVSYMKTGNVFLSCARSEGWNIPLIEAMAAGIPAIYSEWGAQLEFTKDKGLPVKVREERPANIGATLGLAGPCPGDYAEPDYSHLSAVMRRAYEEYEILKEKSANDSLEIRQRFSWDVAAMQGLHALEEGVYRILDYAKPQAAAVVVSHANTPEKEEILKRCILELKSQHLPVIVSSHIPVAEHIWQISDYVIIDRDNPLVYYDELKRYDDGVVFYYRLDPEWEIRKNFEFNHGYAALKLMKNGAAIAEANGFTKTHFINYDFIIKNSETLNRMTSDLDEFHITGYEWDNRTDSINTGLLSARTQDFNQAIRKIVDKRSYYGIRTGFAIIENIVYKCLNDEGLLCKIVNSKEMTNGNDINIVALSVADNKFVGRGNDGRLYFTCIDSPNVEFEISHKKGSHRLVSSYNPLFLEIPEYFLEEGFFVKNLNTEERSFYNKKSNLSWYEIIDEKRKIRMDERFYESPKDAANLLKIHFVDGPHVEISGVHDFSYKVRFIDRTNSQVIYETTIKNGSWARCNRKYYTDWRIEVLNLETGQLHAHEFDARGKKVYVSLESSSLGDSIAWFAHLEEFQKKHGCHLTVSTFNNSLFETEYPEMAFVSPGTHVPDLYAKYSVGWFYEANNTPNYLAHPRDFRSIPMQATTTDILGLPESSLAPRISFTQNDIPMEEPYVCIAIHATAQAKYWNNPTGWQEVVDYLNSKGLKVVLLSHEHDGYMGNAHPTGILHPLGERTLENAMRYLKHAKMFIGIGSGLSWLSWAVGTHTVIISGFSRPETEPQDSKITRIFNPRVCNGCFNRERLDAGDWNWCPDHKGTPRAFECSKSIAASEVISKIDEILEKRKNESAKFIEKPTETRRCLMVHNYFGPRRVHCEEYVEDPLFFAKMQIEHLQKYKHSLDRICFTVNRRGPEDDELIKKLEELLPKQIQTAKTEIMIRPNIGMSYGAFNDVYAKYRKGYDYYFFNEDDYLFVEDNFDNTLIEMFEEKPNAGWMAAIIRDNETYPKHAGHPEGVTSSRVLEDVFQEFGRLAYNPNEKRDDHSYESDELLGNVAQTNQIYRKGYELYDIRERYTLYILMNWPETRYEHWFEDKTAEIIAPVHRVLGKKYPTYKTSH